MGNRFRHFRFRQIMQLHVVLLAYGLSTPQPTLGQDGALPEEVRRTLAENAERLPPLTIDWELRRKSDRSLEALVAALGTPRYDFFRPESGVIMLDQMKYYLRETLERNKSPAVDYKGEFIQETYQSAFDGNLHFAIEEDGVKRYLLSTLDQARTYKPHPEALTRLGFQLRVGKLPASEILHQLGNGGRLLDFSEEDVDGSRHAVIRLSPAPWAYPYWRDREYTYYLDVDKGYAVARIEWRLPDGQLLCRITNSDWLQLAAPEIWLPQQSSCEWRTWHYCPDKFFPEALFYEDITYAKLEREQSPHSVFSPSLEEPGLYVSDPRPEAASKPGALWNESLQRWDYTNPPEYAEIKRQSFRPLRIALNAGVVALIGYLVFTKYRRARQGGR
jgi:hypothetical protein